MEEKTTVNTENAPAEEKLYTKQELDEILERERGALKEKLAESEKLARMDGAQQEKYRRELAEKELERREAAVSRRELMADAGEQLAQAGLPKQLAACLCYESPELCEKSLKAVSEAFGEAVKLAVNERIRGSIPKYTAAGGSDAFLDGLGIN